MNKEKYFYIGPPLVSHDKEWLPQPVTQRQKIVQPAETLPAIF